MNFKEYINQQVINKNNEVGKVISLSDDHIVIEYEEASKTYNPSITFTNHFISFVNQSLNKSFEEYLKNKESLEKQKVEEIKNIQKKYIDKKQKVNKKYDELCYKDYVLKYIFGKDFVYPPLKEFEKKYQKMINHYNNNSGYYPLVMYIEDYRW